MQEQINQKQITKLSLFEGFFNSLMVASSESFAIYFAVKNGVNSFQLGLITILPLLFGSLLQWQIPSRVKESALAPSILISLSVQLLGLIGILMFHGTNDFVQLLLSLILYWSGGLVAIPLWLDWIARYFSPSEFNAFITKRNKYTLLVTVCTFILMGALIQYNYIENAKIVFMVGILARLISMGIQAYLAKRTSQLQNSPSQIMSTASINTDQETTDLKPLVMGTILLTAFFRFAVGTSSPFYVAYMNNVLMLNTFDYVFLCAVPLAGRSLFLSGWGMSSQGLKPFIILPITSFAIALAPIFWTFSPNLAYLSIVEFCNGIFWGGFELACIFIIKNTITENTRKLFGFHMAAMNLFALMGALLGAWFRETYTDYHLLFKISAVIRLFACGLILIFYYKYKDLKLNIKNYGSILFTALSLRPTVSNIGRLNFPRSKYLKKIIGKKTP